MREYGWGLAYYICELSWHNIAERWDFGLVDMRDDFDCNSFVSIPLIHILEDIAYFVFLVGVELGMSYLATQVMMKIHDL